MPRRKGGFRHLIYLIDGTWLWAGSDKTLDVYSNVYRLNTLLKADDEDGRAQIVHYVRGLGAVEGKENAHARWLRQRNRSASPTQGNLDERKSLSA
jgi:uncharacterized protein (DUF2235 family)